MSGQVPFKAQSNVYNGIYRGEVLDNMDPLMRGRCKVAIRPMFADGVSIPAADLPWAIPAYPIFEGAGNGIGYFAVPRIGAKVFCFFEEGDPYSPVYAWEVPDAVNGVPSSATTNYPNRKVVKTTSGIEIYIDDTTQEIKITHPTTGSITMNTGGVMINSSGVTTVNASGAVTIVGATVSINP